MAKDPRLKRFGLSGYNKPKRTPSHPSKSHVVLARYKKGGRTLNKFGSDVQHDYVSKDGLRTQSSDHAQKKRREEHEKRRGVKT